MFMLFLRGMSSSNNDKMLHRNVIRGRSYKTSFCSPLCCFFIILTCFTIVLTYFAVPCAQNAILNYVVLSLRYLDLAFFSSFFIFAPLTHSFNHRNAFCALLKMTVIFFMDGSINHKNPWKLSIAQNDLYIEKKVL